ncbi:hypothetical protein CVS40_10793 [Lucilia cuprina]|nr:hypothetical protein CVS40_10793 [Lucilia cuprina]
MAKGAPFANSCTLKDINFNTPQQLVLATLSRYCSFVYFECNSILMFNNKSCISNVKQKYQDITANAWSPCIQYILSMVLGEILTLNHEGTVKNPTKFYLSKSEIKLLRITTLLVVQLFISRYKPWTISAILGAHLLHS